ncbi:charged multivesicular body protein 4 [Strigomonas culicis]|nr:charged multivesicular body protein 4 [Strigomonas culicis]|eukprot:EPY37129.1 charged multivesicular body protein 4 [Strigomonas culicis]
MFDRMFGKNKQAKPDTKRGTSSSATVEKLDTSIDLLEKREGILQKKIETELGNAKQFYAKKNTQGALACMKRKKTYEDQLISIGAQKNNMETLKFTLQQQSMNKEIIEAQMSAKNELKKENKRMNADKIEDTMDDLIEEMDKANQVSQALQQPLDSNFVDEDDLMAELELEMDESALEAPAQTTHVETKLPQMPAVPSSKLPAKPKVMSKEEEDEEALRLLERELAI